MTGSDFPLDRHAAFVRSLAQSLLADPAAADDVAQEALVRLWQRPPQVALAVRGWLRQVVRRLAQRRLRADARRQRREAAAGAAARAEAAAPLDGVLRAETLRAVTDAVAQLPPALRDVVLLRHHEALPPRAIAARLQLSVAAVETRLRRAHAELALRLRERIGGDRWQASLAVLVGPGFALATPIGVTMTVKSKLALAALPLVLCAAAVVLLREGQAPSVPDAGGPTPAVAAVPDATPGESGAPRDPKASARAATAAPVAAAVVATVRLTGRVVDARRHRVAGATVRLDGLAAPHQAQCGDDGAFELRVERPRGRVDVAVTAQKGELVGRRGGAIDGGDQDLGAFVVEPAGGLPVRVVGNTGAVPGARVTALPVLAAGAAVTATTDARGEAPLHGLCCERHLVVARAPDGRTAHAIGDAYAGNEQWLALDVDRAVALSVVVTQRGTGRPIPGVAVLCWIELPGEGGVVSYVPLHAPAALPHTDAHGMALIEGLRRGGAVRLAVLRAREVPAADAAPMARQVVPIGALDPVEFELETQGELWFELTVAHAMPPQDGDRFEVVTFAGAHRGEAVVRGARLYYSGPAPESGTIWFARDDRRASELLFQDTRPNKNRAVGRIVCFERLRPCTVALRDARGRPLGGLPVYLWCVEHGQGTELPLSQVTDATGTARFVDVMPTPVLATLDTEQPPHDAVPRRMLGTADLRVDDGVITATLAAALHVRADVFVAGERALPGDFSVLCGNGRVANLQEDATNGRFECDVVPVDSSQPLQLQVYGGWRLSVGTATIDQKATEAFVEVKLEPRCAATAAIAWPPDGECQLFVERVFGKDQFSIWTHVPAGRHQDALPRFTNLAPGRYRLRDALSCVRGPELDVDDRATAQLSLDLSMVVPVRGRVTLGPGVRLEDVWLEVVDTAGAIVRRWPIGESFEFATRIDARGDVRLRAAAGERRSLAVPVTGALDGVLLTLP